MISAQDLRGEVWCEKRKMNDPRRLIAAYSCLDRDRLDSRDASRLKLIEPVVCAGKECNEIAIGYARCGSIDATGCFDDESHRHAAAAEANWQLAFNGRLSRAPHSADINGHNESVGVHDHAWYQCACDIGALLTGTRLQFFDERAGAGRSGALKYLLHVRREQMEYPALKRAVIEQIQPPIPTSSSSRTKHPVSSLSRNCVIWVTR